MFKEKTNNIITLFYIIFHLYKCRMLKIQAYSKLKINLPNGNKHSVSNSRIKTKSCKTILERMQNNDRNKLINN